MEPSGTATTGRLLFWVAAVETASLLVLLVNLATVHLPGVAAVFGPVHGSAYLMVIALVFARAHPWRVRLLALIPAVGALLVVALTRAHPIPAPVSDR